MKDYHLAQINTCVFFVCAASQWKLSGRKIFWCPQNCASRTNIFANIHFLLTKHISCWWSALSCSWPSLRGSHNMESIFQASIHFPSCWFLQRVTHCSACSSISDISRSNAIIFHRISGSLSLLLSPLSYLGRQLAPAPQFGGVYHPSVSGSCVPPSLTSSLAPGMLTAIITRPIYRWRLPGYLEA